MEKALTQQSVSKVGLIGVLIILVAALLGDFAILRPNRLVPGEPLSVFEALTVWQYSAFAIFLGMLAYISWKPGKWLLRLAIVIIPLMFMALLWSQGMVARDLAQQGGPFTRVSVGSTLWVALLGLFLIFTDMIQRIRPGAWTKLILIILLSGGISLLAIAGVLDELSIVQEFRSRSDRFFMEFKAHLLITGFSVGTSAILGLPLGIIAFRYAKFKDGVFSVLNIVQTIPSLALFGLLIAPLSYISNEMPLLRSWGVRGIGWAPAVIALTLYALLPIVRNTFSGFATVDRDIIEAGRGMGMGRVQMFFKVELPIAAPIILNGLRVASVQNIGNTAVAALIGAGGFGVFIFQGLGQSAIDLVLLGAVPTILLAVLVDYLYQGVITFITPEGVS